jgi:hypothetical protein
VPSPQKSRRLLLIKPAELLLFSTGADSLFWHKHFDEKDLRQRRETAL